MPQVKAHTWKAAEKHNAIHRHNASQHHNLLPPPGYHLRLPSSTNIPYVTLLMSPPSPFALNSSSQDHNSTQQRPPATNKPQQVNDPTPNVNPCTITIIITIKAKHQTLNMNLLLLLTIYLLLTTYLSTLPLLSFLRDIPFIILLLLLLSILHHLNLPLNTTYSEKIRFLCVLVLVEIWILANFIRAFLLWLSGTDFERVEAFIEKEG
jgi:hypothetical protein